ncbi:hypothetical protein YC2023_015760 [Brassica napus]
MKSELKIIWGMIGLLKVFSITQESYPINFSKCWKQQRGLLKSMDPDSEVKKQEGLTKRFLKLKEDGRPSRQDSQVDEPDVVNEN